MSTVLLAWELGEGFGHVQTLVQIGSALAAQGHRPVLAMRYLVEPWPVYGGAGFPVFSSPGVQRILWHENRPFQASNFADVLGVHGWAGADALAALVHAWQSLIAAVPPQ